MAQEAPTTTTETSAPTTEPPAHTDPPATSESPTSDAPTDTPTSEPTSTRPTRPGPPTTTKPTDKGDGLPHGDDYKDDVAYGVDLKLHNGFDALFVIACAAGEPTNVKSPDFDLVDGPNQEPTDPYYWVWFVKRQPGASFKAHNITASWDCGSRPVEKPIPPAGGAGAPGADTTDDGSQVRHAPKSGVETGGGATARS